MEFNKAYNRVEFLSFLRTSFLPEDFQQETSVVDKPVQFQYTQQVTRLGECDSLGMVVYEMRHSSKHDARVGLTKEAFRLLADYIADSGIDYWIYGHSHRNIDKTIGTTRCVSNQFGYAFHMEHHSFDREKMIVI